MKYSEIDYQLCRVAKSKDEEDVSLEEKKAILLIGVGKKHGDLLRFKLRDFERYALKCGASLIVRKELLDPSCHRSILAQKLLIPEHYSNFDLVAFLDLDLHISEKCPNIFEEISVDNGFSAVLDPRGSEEYKRTWRKFPHVLNETTESYFSSRGFQPKKSLLGSINGGVLLFRPFRVGKIFSEYYWSGDTQSGIGDGNEEAPLAYFSQSSGLFQPLDPRYNKQFIYAWSGTEEQSEFEAFGSRLNQSLLVRLLMKLLQIDIVKMCSMRIFAKYIKAKMADSFIVHMAGGFETRFRLKF